MKYKKTILSCSVCGSKAKRLFRTSDINQKMADLEFDYYRCNSCGMIFIEQIPENLSLFYGDNYAAYQELDFLQNVQIANQEQGKLEVVNEHGCGKNMLEIGPGSGSFSFFAKLDGYEIDVIEMDKGCCEYLKNTIGVNNVIHTVDIFTAMKHIKKQYDVIVLWHVFEHLTNPWRVLEAVSKALAFHGIVVIATPNPESIQFRFFKKYWKHVDAPRHLSLIPMKVLENKAMALGLKPVKITTTDKPSVMFHSYAWWIESLKNYQIENPNSIITRVLRKPGITHSMFFVLYKLMYKFIGSPLEKREGNGAAYTAIFERK